MPKTTKKAQQEQDSLMEKLVADGKADKTAKSEISEGEGWKKLTDEGGIPHSDISLCSYYPKACDWVGTYRCTSDCEFHPQSYNIDKEVLKQFKAEPWAVYCLTCGEFLDSRYGHLEAHVLATGIAEYREKIPEFVMERMKAHNEETGDMSW